MLSMSVHSYRGLLHIEKGIHLWHGVSPVIARIVRGIDRHTLVTMNPTDPRRLR